MLQVAPPERSFEVYASLPSNLRRPAARSAWADANKPGQSVDCFLEGPVCDALGRLYLTDIPYGRIFRLDLARPDGAWTQIAEYDGEPNGMKLHPDGRLWITDYRRGLLAMSIGGGDPEPVLARRNAESFKGLNDLWIAADGTTYFTDQGQTGLHDPSGRVYRLQNDGRLDTLLGNGPSPNGIVVDPAHRVLFIAMTRANAIWRAPMMRDGSLSKVGLFVQLHGTSGPDGIALDAAGNLLVAHASLGSVFAFSPDGECIARLRSPVGKAVTNLTFAGPERRDLFAIESSTGSVLHLHWDHPAA